ncbi:MAG TPA: 16S rRNA (cytosine(967)-C(5))-methyltransferase RsmB [Candidatus Limiplasma sp.]|nr:16S rRNA (cytosine(967)-C(5))-methyltransferase RsmB [Candidatus Limiplasma sp.]
MKSKYPPNARLVALDVLHDIHEKGAYASLALQSRLRETRLAPNDRRLATSIVYTTLEKQDQLDYVLDSLMEHPTQDILMRDILRLSACQILFHERIPESAAVNEGVKLAKIVGKDSVSGFLNAVLRNLVRQKEQIIWPDREKDFAQYLHVMGNMPMWLVNKLIGIYGNETAEAIIMYQKQDHSMTIRPNMLKLTDDAFEKLLNQKSWTWQRGIAPHAYLIGGAVEIGLDEDYQKGLFSIQGQSSMLAAEAVQVKPGMRVLDACAAPGGKTAYMAETMQDTGRVYAWEVHEKRAALLTAMKKRMKLENLRISIRDALTPKTDLEGTLDAVLLDAPCTGLGVIGEKPDLKYRLQEESIPQIVKTQEQLLDMVSRYVKPGGTLVYSTCSILPEENADQIQNFLQNHPTFSVQPLPKTYPEAFRKEQTQQGLQLLPYRDHVEGFFIARMQRQRA